mmetsp:Transcript_40295/g.97304  ORF Transcript_40295/g.97304 Transcript_40295/m.97304 type:complete len:475 (+) Transcript_40295:248-1672(+)|eukprot:CAMPEP_0113476468 /NCGR_PEP_ID=MMETSP0014_2-20120614/19685_1 /TAXON_ID=2857 /ORGANISM="Nitzschia sp." /LENGTH=474 /DNA_ID=CAMNT_0000369487 /DNA_START=172 /DNA_END=1596 /DNA_ORIENTATION=+ /assembly_acc=CAM_ASM_000159
MKNSDTAKVEDLMPPPGASIQNHDTLEGKMGSLDLTNTSSTQDSESSSENPQLSTPRKRGWFSMFATPAKEGKTLKDMFNEEEGLPSPPKINGQIVDMDTNQVDKKLKRYFSSAAVGLFSKESYSKLCWIIGKGLDQVIMKEEGPIQGRLMLAQMAETLHYSRETCPLAQRFHTIYQSVGDTTYSADGLTQPEDFIRNNFAVDIWNEDSDEYEVYTIYSDREHLNIEYYTREQTWGNCHSQGPIALQWLLSLWYNPQKNASDVRMIHLSRYYRNAISNKEFYKYVCKEKGGDSRVRAAALMPKTFEHLICLSNPQTYEELVSSLKECGPALVEFNELYDDFLDPKTVSYYGAVPKNSKELESGHSMLLIGVIKNLKIGFDATAIDDVTHEDNLGHPSTQVWLLLQNWWPGKPFIKVRYDYFVACNGELIFGNGGEPEELTDETYTTETGSIRRAVTTCRLDTGVVHSLVKSDQH